MSADGPVYNSEIEREIEREVCTVYYSTTSWLELELSQRKGQTQKNSQRMLTESIRSRGRGRRVVLCGTPE